jgi:hypothetical protein
MKRFLVLAVLLCATPYVAAQSTRFRVTDLDLRDPHIWVTVFGCNDVTDAPGGINQQIQANYQSDSNGDGFLDASTVLEFLPLDQGAATNLFAAGAANCTAATPTQCDGIAVPLLGGDATLSTVATCGQPIAGTTRPYAPAVTSSTAPCFASVTGTLTLSLSGIPVTLTNAQIAATFVGNPAQSLTNGLMRGFLSEADANATIIPPTVPLIGGRPLSSVLAGGAGSCQVAFSDKDTGPGGVDGWYFYLNFPAQRLADDAFANGFANGFE